MISGRVGLGFDIIKGSFGLPALHMTPGPQRLNGMAIPNEVQFIGDGGSTQHSYTFKSYSDYINSPLLSWAMTPANLGQAQLVGGMMSHNQDLKSIYDKYFTGPISLAVSHDVHRAYRLSSTRGTLDPYFEAALQYLPATPDSSYDLFLDYWGGFYTVETVLGGMMEQQNFLRDCVWSHMDNNKLLDELNNEMRAKAGQSHKMPDGTYVSYRKLGTVDIVGGNPEIPASQYARRVASFSQNPVQVSFHVHRITELVSNPTIRANLDRAITNRINAAKNAQSAAKAKAEAAKLAWFKGPQSIGAGTYVNLDFTLGSNRYLADAHVIGHENIPAGGSHRFPLIVRQRVCHKHCSWFHCHTNCNDEDIHLSVGKIAVDVICERNAEGAVRARTSLEPFFVQWPRQNAYVGGVTYVGPWVTDGCSTAAPYNPHYEHHHHIDDNSLAGNYATFFNDMLSAYPRMYWNSVWPYVEELAAMGSAVCCIGHGLTTINKGGTAFSGHCPPF